MGVATATGGSQTDEELVGAARRGDRAAFAELYVRYYQLSHRFACRLLGTTDGAEDLVAEAFAKVLDRLLVGGGPTTAFHSYLLTTVRTTMYKQWAADRLIDRQAELIELPLVEPDPLIQRLDVFLVVRAFRSLSPRWRVVLWHLEVEGRSVTEVAQMLDLQPNATAALAFRAREALRIAYLQMHVNTDVADGCRESADHLVPWLCGRLHRGMRSRVESHVGECDRCGAAADELAGLVSEMRRMVPLAGG